MYSGKGALTTKCGEKENRISEARLKKTPSAPPRIAKMPATMMDMDARGAEGM